ncbi:unnamed protein product [Prunus armeniaca]
MAAKIVYLDNPKAGSGWKVVQKMDQRNIYAIPKLGPTDNDVNNIAVQHFESSMKNDATKEFASPDSAVSCHCSSPVGPKVPHAPTSSALLVAQPVSTRHRHRPASTTNTISIDATSASGSQPPKKNTQWPSRQLKTAKVTWVTNNRINIGYDERHRIAPTSELHSLLAHDIGHVVRTHCPMQWKSWKVMPDEIKTEVRGQLSTMIEISADTPIYLPIYRYFQLSTPIQGDNRELKRDLCAPCSNMAYKLLELHDLTNYNLEDLDDESLAYINRLGAEKYKQWKSDLHHHFQAFDDLQGVALRSFSGARLCGGSKFPEIDVFGDIYVRPGNELGESLHESASQLPPDTPLESMDPPQDAGFQILTETLDQTLGRRLGTYCKGMGNGRRREPRSRSSSQSNSQVTALTAKVAELQGQMSVLLESLTRFGIPVSHFDPSSTSKLVQPEHGHQTFALVDNVQTSEPHLPDDQVDFGTLFD